MMLPHFPVSPAAPNLYMGPVAPNPQEVIAALQGTVSRDALRAIIDLPEAARMGMIGDIDNANEQYDSQAAAATLPTRPTGAAALVTLDPAATHQWAAAEALIPAEEGLSAYLDHIDQQRSRTAVVYDGTAHYLPPLSPEERRGIAELIRMPRAQWEGSHSGKRRRMDIGTALYAFAQDHALPEDPRFPGANRGLEHYNELISPTRRERRRMDNWERRDTQGQVRRAETRTRQTMGDLDRKWGNKLVSRTLNHLRQDNLTVDVLENIHDAFDELGPELTQSEVNDLVNDIASQWAESFDLPETFLDSKGNAVQLLYPHGHPSAGEVILDVRLGKWQDQQSKRLAKSIRDLLEGGVFGGLVIVPDPPRLTRDATAYAKVTKAPPAFPNSGGVRPGGMAAKRRQKLEAKQTVADTNARLRERARNTQYIRGRNFDQFVEDLENYEFNEMQMQTTEAYASRLRGWRRVRNLGDTALRVSRAIGHTYNRGITFGRFHRERMMQHANYPNERAERVAARRRTRIVGAGALTLAALDGALLLVGFDNVEELWHNLVGNR